MANMNTTSAVPASPRHFAWVVGIAVGVVPPLAAEELYKITDLSQLGGEIARDINNAGRVVGDAYDHAFVYYDLDGDLNPDSGELIDLGALAGQFNRSKAWGMSEAGTIAGESRDAADQNQAIRWGVGMQDLGPSEGHGYGRAINSAGTVVGYLYGTEVQGYRAVRWPGGTWSELWPITAGEGGANDINDAGQIVGWRNYAGQSGRFAFLWQGGSAVSLGQLGGDVQWAEATAINQHGWVVGWSNTAAGETHAFIWIPHGSNATTGTMYDLGTLGGNYSAATGINNRGEVVGVARTQWGEDRPFIYSNGQMRMLWDLCPANSAVLPSVPYAINDRGQIVGQGNLGAILLTPNDADGDGLFDVWEEPGKGIDFDQDGIIDLDLFALGARPDHKDLFVEIDAMVGCGPKVAGLDWVTLIFDRAPVENPDGNGGIKLHLLVDETDIPFGPWNSMTDVNGDGTGDWPPAFDAVKAARFGTPSQRSHTNSANIIGAKRLAFRYCVFADSFGGTTRGGLAEMPGNDFMVTLGTWTDGGDISEHAGTFMHELGHTLGLRHGGGDHVNHKPNYDSVMNYSLQTPGDWNAGFWQPRFSSEVQPTLDETDVDEPAGFGGMMDMQIAVGPPNAALLRMAGPVDCNRDGDTSDTGLSVDLNHVDPSEPASPAQLLYGHNDWEHIVYGVTGNGDYLEGKHASVVGLGEMTLELRELLRGVAPLCDACDVDCNGTVNPFDIQPFLDLLSPSPPAVCSPCAGDADGNGTTNPFDINAFLDCL